MPELHARLSPSSAHRWMNCPSSLAEAERAPKREAGKYADEGTAAHELGERVLKAETPVEDISKEYEGLLAENGWMFDEEMCDEVAKYVRNMRGFADGHELFVEEQVDFSHAIGVPDSFGTSDGVVLTSDGLELQVHDLKYGKGVRVFAEESEQMMLYALGALKKFDMLGTVEHIKLVIHQPRLNHLDEWDCSVQHLREFAGRARKSAQLAVKIADSGKSEAILDNLCAGGKQCRFCPVKATCPAMAKFAAESMGTRLDDLIGDKSKATVEEAIRSVTQLTNDELAAIMPAIDGILDWAKAVRAKVEQELIDGNEVTGFKLVEGRRSARKWASPKEAEEEMKAMRFKSSEMYKMSIQTPTHMEKILKDSPRRWNRISKLIAQESGKPSVAPVSDKRPEMKLATDMSDLLG